MDSYGVQTTFGTALLAAAILLATPAPSTAQEDPYTTGADRLHPRVEVRVQLDPSTHGERWLEGGVGQISIPVGPNIVTCTTVAIPELSPSDGTFMELLSGVERLQVRLEGEEAWTPLELEPLLEAEPARCSGLAAGGQGPPAGEV